MDAIEEMLLLFGGLMVLAFVLFYLVPSSTSISAEFQSQAISQIVLNSFKLVSPQINASTSYASVYDSGFPTTLYVAITEYNASNNQLLATSGEKVSFVNGLNKIPLPSSPTNSYYEIELYDPSGSVLYTTYYVYKYVNNYVQINNVVGNTKIYINGKEVKLNTVNNVATLSLPPGTYNITIFTPYYYYSQVVSFPLSTPLIISIPTTSQLAKYTAYVDQKLPGSTTPQPLVGAVLSLNNQTATYKTGINGNATFLYSYNGIVSLNVSCPPTTCGTAITNNYTTLSGLYPVNSFSSSNPLILYPKFRVIGHLYLTCNGTSYPTPGSISVIATPSNATRNRYSEVNASGTFISYLYAGLYNVSGISFSGLFNSTQINVTHFNQTFSLLFPYCVVHIPYNETIFEETGLPTNTLWNVTYGGAINSSRTNKIIFSELNTKENYTYSIPIVTANNIKYVPEPSSGASPTGKIVYVKFVNTMPTLTISPNPANTQQSVTITATCAFSTDTCAIYYPNLNTQLASGTGTVTYTYPAGSLSAGTYASFYAVDKTYDENSTPQTLTVNQALPAGIQYYVPITITNSQSSATSSPFQQMINISESSFSNYIAYNGNLANFEYFYGNDTIIPGWIEANKSGTLLTWVKLNKGIPASSSVTIYLGFASKTTNLLSNSGTTGIGEASQLSSTYGEYDDIGSVMQPGLMYQVYYDSSGTCDNTNYQNNIYEAPIGNGVTISSCASFVSSTNPFITSQTGTTQNVDGTNQPNVVINYQEGYSGGVAYPNPPVSNNGNSWIIKTIGFADLPNQQVTFYGMGDDGIAMGYSTTSGTSNGQYWLGGTSNPNNIYNGWRDQGATQYSGTVSPGTYAIEQDYFENGGGAYTALWSNVAVNYYSPSYPPNGVMPTYTFGSVS